MSETVRLEASGLTSLTLDEASGYAVRAFDPGFPVVRRVAEDRPDSDGEIDRTAYFGARVVALTVALFPTDTLTMQQVRDKFRAFAHPSTRAYIYYRQADTEDERRLAIIADQQNQPMTNPFLQELTAQWRAPDGIEEAATETEVSVSADAGAEAGRAYDLTFDRTYPASNVAGAVIVTNLGNIPVDPILRLYGPCTNPRIENATDASKSLRFTGVTLAAGEYLEVDVRNRTVRANGDAAANRYSNLDFTLSQWWRLLPGDNNIRYFPETFTAGAAAVLIFRSAWI
jgi:hypothetical protein